MSQSGVVKGVAAALAVVLAVEVVARTIEVDPVVPRARLGYTWMDRGDAFAYDEELGWTLKPSAHLSLAGRDVRTNALGLRGVEPKAPAVICVGDAAVMGLGVEEAESWPARLGERLGVEVLAAGAPGWSSAQARVMLGRLLANYRPTTVIIAVGAVDGQVFPIADGEPPASWWDASVAVRRWAERGRRRAAATVSRLRKLADEAHALYPPRDEAQAARFVALQRDMDMALAGSPARVSLPGFRANLAAMVAMVKAAGARPILLAPTFASISTRPRFADLTYRSPVKEYREAMQDVARREGAAFVALPPLTEEGKGDQRVLFLSRALAEEEAKGLALLPANLSAGKGFSLDHRSAIDLALPSAVGHQMVAESVAPIVVLSRGPAPSPVEEGERRPSP